MEANLILLVPYDVLCSAISQAATHKHWIRMVSSDQYSWIQGTKLLGWKFLNAFTFTPHPERHVFLLILLCTTS